MFIVLFISCRKGEMKVLKCVSNVNRKKRQDYFKYISIFCEYFLAKGVYCVYMSFYSPFSGVYFILLLFKTKRFIPVLLFSLRTMYTLGRFSAIFTKGSNFCDFQLAFLCTKTFLYRDQF